MSLLDPERIEVEREHVEAQNIGHAARHAALLSYAHECYRRSQAEQDEDVRQWWLEEALSAHAAAVQAQVAL